MVLQVSLLIPDSDVIFPTPDGELAHRDSRNILLNTVKYIF
ncbi:hypothetical protein AD24_1787 [Escherichia coli 2-011-08_S4_C3]|nr:hypothetical protein AC56_4245 [Escherichia coli 1-182-04_S3_C3]EZJ86339.1 hypothetical protein AC27_1586 [Escherichia coli 1-182-04_S3_C2]EZJ99951.1 hypothetical protein AB99_1906 [Escherichia coli 1-182-04_S3_C1]KDT21007.1 hypothetical protein AD24_1787 [Escherichia coli 2-011-08_S4_C3]KDT89712.1 hypothetical protein AB20_1787 [Escherichia coli 3-475-03_S1_C1]KDW22947.1 hypothetical protein AC68_1777 [Escherichia coli 2-156-04_S4_C1]KDX41659.1 hypothetical protein AD26_1846 [Escherichia 